MANIGFYKCGHKICRACNHTTLTKTCKSTSDPSIPPFKIMSHINCNSKNVIYIIECIQCSLQYVGCTSNPLKVRIRRHLTDITNVTSLNVSAASRHFTNMHNRDTTFLKFTGIEKVRLRCRGCLQ